MGKSQRIRDERAAATAKNPEKHLKSTKNDKKMTAFLAISFAVVIVLIVALSAIFILKETGSFTRMQIVASSENYKINANMMAYYYSCEYNELYYEQYYYSQILGTEIKESDLKETALKNVKTKIKSLLALCEAAKTAGTQLTADDREAIDATVKGLNDQLESYKALGYALSLGDIVGNPNVKEQDIRAMEELMLLSSRFAADKKQSAFDTIIANDAELAKYIEEHKSSVYMADYLSFTVDTKEEAETLALITDVTEFKSQIIKLAVEKNFETELDKLKLDANAPVASLSEALKEVIVAELRYSLLDIKIEGLDLEAKTERVDRIKAIFEKLYGGKTFEKVDTDKTTVTTMNEMLYTNVVKLAEALNTTANSAITKATVNGDYYYETKDSEGKDITPSEQDKWVFDEAKANEAKYFTITTTASDKTTTTYNVVLMIKPTYLDTEITKNVAHILFKAETTTISDSMTADKKAEAEKKNEEAYAAAKKKAEDILNQYLAGDKTKDAFEALGKEHTEDTSVSYNNVHTGDMVEEFENWLFDSARKVGDTGLVKTQYGYHVMYFVGDGYAAYKVSAASQYATEEYNDWFGALKLDEITSVDTAAIDKLLK